MNLNIDNMLSDSQYTTFVLHNIGKVDNNKRSVKANYTTREKIITSKGLLTFDGCYRNVYENRDILKGRDFILFLMPEFVGKDNSFDVGMPKEKFCTWKEIDKLVSDYGGKLGFHTNNHKDLTKLPNDEIEYEVTPPFPTKYFAYPHGKFDNRVIEYVKRAGYKYAFGAGHRHGKGNFRIKRDYL